MRKYTIIALCGIIVIGVTMFIFFSVLGNQKNTFNENESEKIKIFFKNKFFLFNNIKDELWPSKYDFVSLYQDGRITYYDKSGNPFEFHNATISEKAINYYKISKFPNPSIECDQIDNSKTIKFLFYYSANRMRVGIVYSEADLSKSNFYEPIQNNWYFLQQGMT